MPKGPKYHVNIEGTIHDWDNPTITTEQIANLGGWDVGVGVIEIDKENNERTLAPGEVVELKPGQGFGKKIRWKRGLDRVTEEIELLREVYNDLEFDSRAQWIRIPGVPLPDGWNREEVDIAVQIPPAYPGAPPYGIYVPIGIRFGAAVPKNYKEPAAHQPPFVGKWGVFSWTPSDGVWRVTADARTGANLLRFVRGAFERFEQGA